MRHVRGCSPCREFRDGLKASRNRLRALVPPVGMGPLAGVLQLLGGATGGGGVATKVVAGTSRLDCALRSRSTASRVAIRTR